MASLTAVITSTQLLTAATEITANLTLLSKMLPPATRP